MYDLVNPDHKEFLDLQDLKRISEQLKYNMGEDELQEVINNVAGFGKQEISWEQFNRYIAKKVDKK